MFTFPYLAPLVRLDVLLPRRTLDLGHSSRTSRHQILLKALMLTSGQLRVLLILLHSSPVSDCLCLSRFLGPSDRTGKLNQDCAVCVSCQTLFEALSASGCRVIRVFSLPIPSFALVWQPLARSHPFQSRKEIERCLAMFHARSFCLRSPNYCMLYRPRPIWTPSPEIENRMCVCVYVCMCVCVYMCVCMCPCVHVYV